MITLSLTTSLALLALAPAQQGNQRIPQGIQRTSEARTEPAPGTELRLFDIAPLSGERRLRALIDGLVATSDPTRLEAALAQLQGVESLGQRVRSTADSIAATVRELIQPPLQAPVQRVDSLGNGTLALVGSAQQQAWLAEFLAAGSAFDGLISVEAKIIVFDRGGLERFTRARSGEVLAPEQLADLLRALSAAGVEAVTAPSVTTFPFQEAMLSVLDQVAYVRDYELKVIPEQDAEIADPIIDVVDSGITLQLRAIPLAHEQLSVFASLVYVDLARPIPTKTLTLGAGHNPVTIQLPEVTKVKLEGRFALRSGETLLLATSDPKGEKEVLALLQVRTMPAERPSER